jgi:hypothetical protein
MPTAGKNAGSMVFISTGPKNGMIRIGIFGNK